MKRFPNVVSFLACLCLLLSACGQTPEEATAPSLPYSNIEFEDGQYYAVAYLGYDDMGALADFSQRYLGGAEVPVHQISQGECYLIIPRYQQMGLKIYANTLEPQQSTLFYESETAAPFVLQCNISDIFPDSTVCFSWEGTDIEFSPYQSLMDGSLQTGPQGLDLTLP